MSGDGFHPDPASFVHPNSVNQGPRFMYHPAQFPEGLPLNNNRFQSPMQIPLPLKSSAVNSSSASPKADGHSGGFITMREHIPSVFVTKQTPHVLFGQPQPTLAYVGQPFQFLPSFQPGNPPILMGQRMFVGPQPVFTNAGSSSNFATGMPPPQFRFGVGSVPTNADSFRSDLNHPYAYGQRTEQGLFIPTSTSASIPVVVEVPEPKMNDQSSTFYTYESPVYEEMLTNPQPQMDQEYISEQSTTGTSGIQYLASLPPLLSKLDVTAVDSKASLHIRADAPPFFPSLSVISQLQHPITHSDSSSHTTLHITAPSFFPGRGYDVVHCSHAVINVTEGMPLKEWHDKAPEKRSIHDNSSLRSTRPNSNPASALSEVISQGSQPSPIQQISLTQVTSSGDKLAVSKKLENLRPMVTLSEQLSSLDCIEKDLITDGIAPRASVSAVSALTNGKVENVPTVTNIEQENAHDLDKGINVPQRSKSSKHLAVCTTAIANKKATTRILNVSDSQEVLLQSNVPVTSSHAVMDTRNDTNKSLGVTECESDLTTLPSFSLSRFVRELNVNVSAPKASTGQSSQGLAKSSPTTDNLQASHCATGTASIGETRSDLSTDYQLSDLQAKDLTFIFSELPTTKDIPISMATIATTSGTSLAIPPFGSTFNTQVGPTFRFTSPSSSVFSMTGAAVMTPRLAVTRSPNCRGIVSMSIRDLLCSPANNMPSPSIDKDTSPSSGKVTIRPMVDIGCQTMELTDLAGAQSPGSIAATDEDNLMELDKLLVDYKYVEHKVLARLPQMFQHLGTPEKTRMDITTIVKSYVALSARVANVRRVLRQRLATNKADKHTCNTSGSSFCQLLRFTTSSSTISDKTCESSVGDNLSKNNYLISCQNPSPNTNIVDVHSNSDDNSLSINVFAEMDALMMSSPVKPPHTMIDAENAVRSTEQPSVAESHGATAAELCGSEGPENISGIKTVDETVATAQYADLEQAIPDVQKNVNEVGLVRTQDTTVTFSEMQSIQTKFKSTTCMDQNGTNEAGRAAVRCAEQVLEQNVQKQDFVKDENYVLDGVAGADGNATNQPEISSQVYAELAISGAGENITQNSKDLSSNVPLVTPVISLYSWPTSTAGTNLTTWSPLLPICETNRTILNLSKTSLGSSFLTDANANGVNASISISATLLQKRDKELTLVNGVMSTGVTISTATLTSSALSLQNGKKAVNSSAATSTALASLSETSVSSTICSNLSQVDLEDVIYFSEEEEGGSSVPVVSAAVTAGAVLDRETVQGAGFLKAAQDSACATSRWAATFSQVPNLNFATTASFPRFLIQPPALSSFPRFSIPTPRPLSQLTVPTHLPPLAWNGSYYLNGSLPNTSHAPGQFYPPPPQQPSFSTAGQFYPPPPQQPSFSTAGQFYPPPPQQPSFSTAGQFYPPPPQQPSFSTARQFYPPPPQQPSFSNAGYGSMYPMGFAFPPTSSGTTFFTARPSWLQSGFVCTMPNTGGATPVVNTVIGAVPMTNAMTAAGKVTNAMADAVQVTNGKVGAVPVANGIADDVVDIAKLRLTLAEHSELSMKIRALITSRRPDLTRSEPEVLERATHHELLRALQLKAQRQSEDGSLSAKSEGSEISTAGVTYSSGIMAGEGGVREMQKVPESIAASTSASQNCPPGFSKPAIMLRPLKRSSLGEGADSSTVPRRLFSQLLQRKSGEQNLIKRNEQEQIVQRVPHNYDKMPEHQQQLPQEQQQLQHHNQQQKQQQQPLWQLPAQQQNRYLQHPEEYLQLPSPQKQQPLNSPQKQQNSQQQQLLQETSYLSPTKPPAQKLPPNPPQLLDLDSGQTCHIEDRSTLVCSQGQCRQQGQKLTKRPFPVHGPESAAAGIGERLVVSGSLVGNFGARQRARMANCGVSANAKMVSREKTNCSNNAGLSTFDGTSETGVEVEKEDTEEQWQKVFAKRRDIKPFRISRYGVFGASTGDSRSHSKVISKSKIKKLVPVPSNTRKGPAPRVWLRQSSSDSDSSSSKSKK